MVAVRLNPLMKTNQEIRHQNLMVLVKECGGQRPLAAKIGRGETQVNSWVKKKKGIGKATASLLESKFRKPSGWMDHEHIGVAEHGATYSAKSSEVVYIPRMDVSASMGPAGMIHGSEEIVTQVSILRRWLIENLTFTNVANLRLITGRGDSMEETISDGDPIVVDTGINEIKLDAIYVLARQDELFIKRIQRKLDGSFLVISDNKEHYDPYPLTKKDLENLKVCGRALFVWNGRKL